MKSVKYICLTKITNAEEQRPSKPIQLISRNVKENLIYPTTIIQLKITHQISNEQELKNRFKELWRKLADVIATFRLVKSIRPKELAGCEPSYANAQPNLNDARGDLQTLPEPALRRPTNQSQAIAYRQACLQERL